MSAQIRTFISVDVPITNEIRNLLKEVKGMPNVKPVPEGQIHITLKFLGDLYPDKVDKLCNALHTSLAETSCFNLTLKGIGAFPDIKGPRVIWIGIEGTSELMSLAETVNETAMSLKLKSDDRGFNPHMTVGRINEKTDVRSLMASHKDDLFCTFRCTHVNVMKSELTPNGARHSVMDRIELNW